MGAAGAVLLGGASAARAVTFGQIDNFEDGTVMNWTHGAVPPPPNPPNPSNVPTGGPGGTDDNFLYNYSLGTGDSHSRQIIFNNNQWSGNYNAAGVTRISGFMNNIGSTTLHMRVAVQGAGTNRYGSTNAITLAPGSGWQPVAFDLTPATMTNIAGSDTLQTVLESVSILRILSAQLGPSWQGDTIESVIGIDNLRAQTRPGDANLDRVINLSDFNILAANFGTGSGATWQQADFNFDGIVNLTDFNALAANFGLTFGPGDPSADDWATLGAAVVPEPVTGMAGALLAAATLARRRRR
jgi:hypothetical protein